MKTIGKYQILAEIGCSAAGKTYRVRDNLTESALKVLNSSDTLAADLKDEFCRDLAACAELRHPHLAKIQDLGELDGAPYIATELLAGTDLRAQLEERRVIPLARKLELMAQACDGLAAAHSKGIAHGNIKPGNIFIAAGGDAQVLDFGIGRWLWLILSAGARPEKLFPNYFAPEQILGHPFDARSDVFSTALVLYEWVAGKYPFQVPAGLIPREIVHTELESFRKAAAEIPRALDRLVARALNKDREQRLETAGEFAEGLRGIIRQLDAERAAAPRPVPVPVIAAPAPQIPAQPPSPKPAVIAAAATPAVARAGRSSLFRKRLIVYSIAAVLAVCAFVTLLSRKSIRASQNTSQNKGPAPTANVRRIEAVTPANAQLPTTAPVTTATPSAAVAAPIPALDETALLAQVKSAWQAGAYTRAMRLVNQILAANPASAEAKLWKKKIRSAQDAEEEMK